MDNLPPPECVWPVGPLAPRLTNVEVHLWCIGLNQSAPFSEDILSPDELARANRFKFPVHRRRFVAAHGWLRALLGRYQNCHPAELRFDYGPQGKPALAGQTDLHFNLAHSGELALLAVAPAELGVDVEAIRPVPELDQIARRFFAPTEHAQIRQLPAEQQQPAFFTCWTRKEAFLKATGDGLTRPLDSFSVAVQPEQPAQFNHITGDDAARWWLAALTPAIGYVGALAITGRHWQIHCWQTPANWPQNPSLF